MPEFNVGDPGPTEDLKAPRRDESDAREVFGPHMSGDLYAVADPPDFILCRDGFVVGWAEVTTAVDDLTEALRNRLAKDGTSIKTDRLHHNWMVAFEKTAKLKDIDRDWLVDVLVSRETMGQRERDLARDAALREQFQKFGIAYADQLREVSGSATVYLGPPAFSSSVGASLITDLAEAKAKVKAASLEGRDGERHLLVLVNADWPTGAGFALTDEDLSEEVPELPESITDVWMAVVARLLWHYSKATGAWELIKVR